MTKSRRAKLRIAAHKCFDPIWEFGSDSRGKAYQWLAQELGLPPDRCHMKLMDEAQLLRVIELCGGPEARVEIEKRLVAA